MFLDDQHARLCAASYLIEKKTILYFAYEITSSCIEEIHAPLIDNCIPFCNHASRTLYYAVGREWQMFYDKSINRLPVEAHTAILRLSWLVCVINYGYGRTGHGLTVDVPRDWTGDIKSYLWAQAGLDSSIFCRASSASETLDLIHETLKTTATFFPLRPHTRHSSISSSYGC